MRAAEEEEAATVMDAEVAAAGSARSASAIRSATARVFQLLDVFTSGTPGLSLTEMSRRSGLPLTTVHRFAHELHRIGVLECDSDGVYRIGLRLWEIAAHAPRGVGLREAAMPFLEDLYEATHENVQLAVRDGHDVVYIEHIAGRRAVGVRTQVGLRFPLHATGVGLVLLAFADDWLQEEVMREPLASFTPKTIKDPAALRRQLAEVRRQGFAISDRQVTMDAMSVASPVRDAEDAVVAAVSLVVTADVSPTAIAPAVVAAGRGISRVLRNAGMVLER
jgi:DNA-binding IclR family transcriptional regulator